MKKKFFAPLMGAVVLGLSAYAGYRTYDAYNGVSESDLLLANAEALAGDESPKLAQWWDFFNNYVKTEKMEVNTSTCVNGELRVKGVTVKVESCTKYTYAIVDLCYDGGNKTECTGTRVVAYI